MPEMNFHLAATTALRRYSSMACTKGQGDLRWTVAASSYCVTVSFASATVLFNPLMVCRRSAISDSSSAILPSRSSNWRCLSNNLGERYVKWSCWQEVPYTLHNEMVLGKRARKGAKFYSAISSEIFPSDYYVKIYGRLLLTNWFSST